MHETLIAKYEAEVLAELIAELASTDRWPVHVEEVLNKPQMTAVIEHLGTLGTALLIAEQHYVDRDYLEDYGHYFSRNFHPPRSHCGRIHFFDSELDQSRFESELSSGSTKLEELLQESYLGFLVIKPLPESFLGRLCLDHRCATQSGAFVPCWKRVEVHLLGCSLYVDSSPLQEQDGEISRCATSALWSSLHASRYLGLARVPSPFELTRSALAYAPTTSRTFPTKEGLSAAQIIDAVKSLGLESAYIEVNDPADLVDAAYAFLRGGFAPMIGVGLHKQVLGRFEFADYHLVSAVGYNLGPERRWSIDSLPLRARRISRLVVHDDQRGPYTSLEFSTSKGAMVGGSSGPFGYLQMTAIPDYVLAGATDGASAPSGVVPYNLIAPVPKMLRVGLSHVLSLVRSIHGFLLLDVLEGNAHHLPDLEWDVYLAQSSILRAELLQEAQMDGPDLLDLQVEPLPKHVWRVTLRENDTTLLDLLFDATDIVQGGFFLRAITFDHGFSKDRLAGILSRRDPGKQISQVLQWFVDRGVISA